MNFFDAARVQIGATALSCGSAIAALVYAVASEHRRHKKAFKGKSIKISNRTRIAVQLAFNLIQTELGQVSIRRPASQSSWAAIMEYLGDDTFVTEFRMADEVLTLGEVRNATPRFERLLHIATRRNNLIQMTAVTLRLLKIDAVSLQDEIVDARLAMLYGLQSQLADRLKVSSPSPFWRARSEPSLYVGYIRGAWRILIREVIAFGAVGSGALIIDVTLFNLFFHSGNSAILAKAISTIIATLITYIGNRRLSFSHRARARLGREIGFFFVINLIVLLFSLLFLGAFIHFSNYGDHRFAVNIANLLTIIAGTVFRFWCYKRFVFLHPHRIAAGLSDDDPVDYAPSPTSTIDKSTDLPW